MAGAALAHQRVTLTGRDRGEAQRCEVGGRGREHGSGDRRWREVGEAASVRCDEVMATPRRIGVGLLGQQK